MHASLAHEVMSQFTPDGFLAGEGHPLNGVSAKGCRPVDLGYNVEESLPRWRSTACSPMTSRCRNK